VHLHLHAIHSRHDNVEQHKVKPRGTFLQHCKRLLTASVSQGHATEVKRSDLGATVHDYCFEV
jgi:hypothetical protein